MYARYPVPLSASSFLCFFSIITRYTAAVISFLDYWEEYTLRLILCWAVVRLYIYYECDVYICNIQRDLCIYRAEIRLIRDYVLQKCLSIFPSRRGGVVLCYLFSSRARSLFIHHRRNSSFDSARSCAFSSSQLELQCLWISWASFLNFRHKKKKRSGERESDWKKPSRAERADSALFFVALFIFKDRYCPRIIGQLRARIGQHTRLSIVHEPWHVRQYFKR